VGGPGSGRKPTRYRLVAPATAQNATVEQIAADQIADREAEIVLQGIAQYLVHSPVGRTAAVDRAPADRTKGPGKRKTGHRRKRKLCRSKGPTGQVCTLQPGHKGRHKVLPKQWNQKPRTANRAIEVQNDG